VIDWKISYSISGGAYQTLETGITTRDFIATNLVAGTVYGFKVEARNTFGYSALSSEVLIEAAEEPSKPDTPTTTFEGVTVRINWVAPFDGGSAILGYRIYIEESDGFSYSLELDDCDGSSS
jgi:hypothetical protein